MSINDLSQLVDFSTAAVASATTDIDRAMFEGQRQAFAFMLQAEQEANRWAAEIAAQCVPTRHWTRVHVKPSAGGHAYA